MENYKVKLVNDDKVFDTMCNLFFRWEDECMYEDFKDYVDVMAKCVEKSIGEIGNPRGTIEPFGLVFDKENERLHLQLIIDGDSGLLRLKKAA